MDDGRRRWLAVVLGTSLAASYLPETLAIVGGHVPTHPTITIQPMYVVPSLGMSSTATTGIV